MQLMDKNILSSSSKQKQTQDVANMLGANDTTSMGQT